MKDGLAVQIVSWTMGASSITEAVNALVCLDFCRVVTSPKRPVYRVVFVCLTTEEEAFVDPRELVKCQVALGISPRHGLAAKDLTPLFFDVRSTRGPTL
jgi:hypothetical protein